MISFLKRSFLLLIANIKNTTLSKALLVILLATMFMAVGVYFYPQNFFKYFYDVDLAGRGDAANYFDFFVRNGAFKIPYYLIIALAFAWVTRLVVNKFWRKAVSTRSTLSFLVIGVLISIFLYSLPPYYLPDLESYYDLDTIKTLNEIPWDDEGRVRSTGDEFCGNRLDLFFLPYDGISIKAFNIIKSLESELPFEINYRCLSERLNENILCEKNHGVKYFKESKELVQKWGGAGAPEVVLGCQNLYGGLYSAGAYKEAICKDLGICNLTTEL